MAVSVPLSSSLSFLRSASSSSLSSTALTSNFRSKNAQFPKIEAKVSTRREDRTARHERIRKKVHGTPERPRLCVFRSNKHLSVQVIDDTKMHTLASASTMQKSVAEEFPYTSAPTIEVAKRIGETIAKVCLEKA